MFVSSLLLLLLLLPASMCASVSAATTTAALQIINWAEFSNNQAEAELGCTLQVYVYGAGDQLWHLQYHAPVTDSITLLPCFQQPVVESVGSNDTSIVAAVWHMLARSLTLISEQMPPAVQHLASVTCSSASVLPPHGLHYVCHDDSIATIAAQQRVLYAVLTPTAQHTSDADQCIARSQSKSAFALQCYHDDEQQTSWTKLLQQRYRSLKAAGTLQKLLRSIMLLAGFTHLFAALQWWRLTTQKSYAT